MKSRLQTLLLAAAIFALNAALNVPLFRSGESVYRGSIEAGYVSMARFFAAHPNPWGWNPAQYCGLPTQFTYLPGMPYLTAALQWLLPRCDIAHLYRILVATLVCLGPVTLFLFVVYFTKSRWWALATALAYTLISPVYGLIDQVNYDRGVVQLPWRIQVLTKYGEGPHTAGLTLLPLTIIALWSAAASRKFRQVFLGAVLLAAIALMNWIAAMALAFCCVAVLLTASATAPKSGLRSSRILAAAVLAYLLACFWLTPRFIKTIAFNWPADSFDFHARVTEWIAIAGWVAGLLILRSAFRRFPDQPYLCFLALSVFAFAYVVFNYYWYGVDTIPESRRYAVEFELFLFALIFELLRQTFRSPSLALKYWAAGFAAFLLFAGAGQARRYLTQGFTQRGPLPKEPTIEYRLATWIAEHPPVGRVFASGTLRFRFNSWSEIPQVGGTFESGLRNRTPLVLGYQIRSGITNPPGRDARDAILLLKALGVEYVVINGPKSRQYYRDFKNPGKFEGVLESVYREEDDVIYRLPVASLAHLVRPGELPAQLPIGERVTLLEPYVAALEDPARPKLAATWRNPSELQIEGPVPDGMLISVQVSYEGGWVATQDGVRIPAQGDSMNFTVLRPRPSPLAHITMKYRGTREQRAMAAISVLAWMGACGVLIVGRRRG